MELGKASNASYPNLGAFRGRAALFGSTGVRSPGTSRAPQFRDTESEILAQIRLECHIHFMSVLGVSLFWQPATRYIDLCLYNNC